MKLSRFLGIVIACCFFLPVVARDKKTDRDRFNFGVKAGVNAPFLDLSNFTIDGVEYPKPALSSRVGYLFAVFSRVNFNRHYIQLEASTHYTQSEVAFDLTDFFPELSIESPQTIQPVSIKMRTLEFPLLYGYNFVKNGPYELSFFVGPKLKYVFKTKRIIDGNPIERINFEERIRPITANMVIGVGTSISNLLLDVRYEFGMMNISESATYQYTSATGEARHGTVGLNRVMNQICFSVGMVF